MSNNYLDKVKKYFWFSSKEFNGFILTTVIFAFIYSFDSWGIITFNLSEGLFNLFIAVLLCGFSLFVHHAGQRLVALHYGFKTTHKVWWPGIIIALLLAFLTKGHFEMYAASAVFITLMPHHRIGKVRPGENIGALGKISAAGPVSNVILASLAVILTWIGILPESISHPIFMFNLYFAVWNLLPFPPLDGSRVLFYSRLFYIFFITSILGYILLIWLLGVYSYIFALIIGIVSWFLFYWFFESK